MEREAVWLTLRLAATTTLVLLAFGVPLAWWLCRGGGWWRTVLQAVVALPLVLPPTVIGYYLLVGFGPMHGLGRWVTRMLGHPLAFSFSGLLVGSAIYSVPFAVQPVVAGFRAVDRTFGEAAAGLGMGPVKTLVKVTLPMARASIGAAAVLVFLHTVGEFGVVLMLGGNIAGVTRTLSIVLFDQVSDMNYAAANRTAGWLAVVAMVGLLGVYGVWMRRSDDAG